MQNLLPAVLTAMCPSENNVCAMQPVSLITKDEIKLRQLSLSQNKAEGKDGHTN